MLACRDGGLRSRIRHFRISSSGMALPRPTAVGDAALVVCEQHDAWSSILRTAAKRLDIAMRRCDSLAACAQHVAEAPASLVLMQLDDRTMLEGLRLLVALTDLFPASRFVVAVPPGSPELKASASAAGAAHVVSSFLEAADVAEIARRHFAALPEPQMTPAERIWSSLPWGDSKARLRIKQATG